MNFPEIRTAILDSILVKASLKEALILGMSDYLHTPDTHQYPHFFEHDPSESELELFTSPSRAPKPDFRIYGAEVKRYKEHRQERHILSLLSDVIGNYNMSRSQTSWGYWAMDAVASVIAGSPNWKASINNSARKSWRTFPKWYGEFSYRFLLWEENPYISSLGRDLLEYQLGGDSTLQAQAYMTALSHIQDLVGSHAVAKERS